MLTQKGFAKDVGDQAVIWIDPAKITLHSSSKWPVTKDRIARANARFPKFLVDIFRPSLRKREPFLTPAAHFKITGPIKASEKYQLVEDFIANRGTPEASTWFQKLSQQLEQSGVATHKNIKMKSRSDIDAFFAEYVEPLINDLETNGFVADHTGFESTALIAADGAVIKSGSGNHRFSICKSLGTSRFPLRIVGMHVDYFTTHSLTKAVTPKAVLNLLEPIQTNHR